MRIRSVLSVFSLAMLAVLAAACGDDLEQQQDVDASPEPDAPGVQAVTIDFAARVGGEAFQCGQTYDGIGATASAYVASDFRFYVHDVRLIGSAGEVPVTLDVDEWQTAEGIALLDFEDATADCQTGSAGTHTAVTGTVPADTYTGVAFKVGVPFEQNHLDVTTAVSPLNIPALYWAWSSGYKFLKMDGVVNGQGFNLHVGSTGCGTTGTTPPDSPCANPNIIEVSLPDFTPGTQTIIADPAPVFADVDVSVNTANTPPGCQSFPDDPECGTVLPKLGLPYGGNPADTQALFAAE